ncbi:DUF4262 domain-containing protein [Nonomuraea sp. NPDC026600]|uniref:DUF4262 domain-containing protein n=1 Tax=Nonomuraea sp. NPDC026600 TaxID=3155363 RepID=UPI0033DD73DF
MTQRRDLPVPLLDTAAALRRRRENEAAAYLSRARRMIADRGWLVQSETGLPRPLSYTAGLSLRNLPELLVVGVAEREAAELLNATAKVMIESPVRFTVGSELDVKVGSAPPRRAHTVIHEGNLQYLALVLYGPQPCIEIVLD